MAKFSTFEEIEAWQRARELAKSIYRITYHGAFAGDRALCVQIRRASISIMANIAEGFERNGKKEFIQFLSVAKGSSGEVRAHLYIALDQGYIDQKGFDALSDISRNISRMIGGLIKYLRSTQMKGAKYL
jgi:four helix bundle protein